MFVYCLKIQATIWNSFLEWKTNRYWLYWLKKKKTKQKLATKILGQILRLRI